MSKTLSDSAATLIADLAHRPPVRVAPRTPLGQVVAALCRHEQGAVLVEDGGRLVGIFSERDLMMRVDHNDGGWAERPVSDMMTPAPTTIRADRDVGDAINLMLTGDHRHLPVVNVDGEVVGMVSIRDILSHIAACFPAEFLNLRPIPSARPAPPGAAELAQRSRPPAAGLTWPACCAAR